MKTNINYVSAGRYQNINPNGSLTPTTISCAWNFNEGIEEDLFIENKGNKIPFLIIPLSEGEIRVKLQGNPGEIYTISQEEVSAFIGSPMLYLVETILSEGTTVNNFSIGL